MTETRSEHKFAASKFVACVFPEGREAKTFTLKVHNKQQLSG